MLRYLLLLFIPLLLSFKPDDTKTIDLKYSNRYEINFSDSAGYRKQNLQKNDEGFFICKYGWDDSDDSTHFKVIINSDSSIHYEIAGSDDIHYKGEFTCFPFDGNKIFKAYSPFILRQKNGEKLNITLDFVFLPNRNILLLTAVDCRTGVISIDNKSFDLVLYRRYSGKAGFENTEFDALIFDLNKDKKFNSRTIISSDGKIVKGEEFICSNTIKLGEKAINITSISADGMKFTYKEIDKEKYPGTGFIAPNYQLNTIEEKTLDSRKLKGIIQVLHFWSANCMFSEEVRPSLNELARKYKGNKNINFISNAKENKIEASEHLINHPLEYLNTYYNKEFTELYNINQFPCDIIIDKEGKIVFFESGGYEDRAAVMEKIIEELL